MSGRKRELFKRTGWRVHGWSFPLVYLARRFKPGSWPNEALYSLADRIAWRKVLRTWGQQR